MPISLIVNGQSRVFENLAPSASMTQVVAALDMKGDRIAVEHNGEIASRVRWDEIPVNSGDRLEVVHFVGGGK